MSVQLETERLFLRDLLLNDLDPLAPILANPEVMRFALKPLGREEVRRWIREQAQSFEEHGVAVWAVIHRDTGTLVGQAGLVAVPIEGKDELELTCTLDEPFWRNGFARETLTALSEHAFGALERERVVGVIHRKHRAGNKLAKALGMSLEKEITRDGERHNLFSLHRPPEGSKGRE